MEDTQTLTPQTDTSTQAPATAQSVQDDITLLGTKTSDAAKDDSTLLGKKDVEVGKEVPKETPGIPEKYEFKLPEGIKLDEKAVEAFTPIFKELNLNQEQAQKLVDAYAPIMKQQAEAQQQAAIDYFQNMVTDWRKETIAELSKSGGDWQKELGFAAKFIDQFGTPELRALLDKTQTGLGNHPELVKAFIKAGKTISQDSFADSNQQNSRGTPSSDLERAKVLYS